MPRKPRVPGVYYDATSGLYWGKVRDPRNGKWKRVRAKDPAIAGDKLLALRQGLATGALPEANATTVQAYLTAWLDGPAKVTLAPKTWNGYRAHVNRVVPVIGRHKLHRLTPLHLDTLYAGLLGDGLDRRTVASIHSTLRRAFNAAVRSRALTWNPCSGATPPRADRARFRVLSEPDQHALVAVSTDHPLHALVVVALATGMRQGELLGLSWADVDLDRRRLAVNYSLGKVDGGFVRNPPKTKTSRRTIPLTGQAADALRVHLTAQKAALLAHGRRWGNKWDLVFTTPDGSPLDATHMCDGYLRPLLIRAGIPPVVDGPDGRPWKFRFHDLRHTCATSLLRRGTNPKLVQALLGHATVAITLDTYSHVLPDMLDDVADTLASIMSPRIGLADHVVAEG